MVGKRKDSQVEEVVQDILTEAYDKSGLVKELGRWRLKNKDLNRKIARGGETLPQSIFKAYLNDNVSMGFGNVHISPWMASESRFSDNIDISTEFCGYKLPLPLISANMTNVTGKEMALVMAQYGGLGAIPQQVEIKEAVEIADHVLSEDVAPIVSAGDNGQEFIFEPALDHAGRYLVSAALSGGGDFQKRAEELYQTGVRIFMVDVAHGLNEHSVESAVKYLRDKYGNEIGIVGGNVANPKGHYYLFDWGVDATKNGIGPGISCRTRDNTGAGRGQLLSTLEGRLVADYFTGQDGRERNIITDGGLKKGQDALFALLVGADVSMIGGILAATEKSRGYDIRFNEDRGKVRYFGMASSDVKEEQGRGEHDAPEGTVIWLDRAGKTELTLMNFAGWLRSGASYVGMDGNGKTDIQRMRENARVTFIGSKYQVKLN